MRCAQAAGLAEPFPTPLGIGEERIPLVQSAARGRARPAAMRGCEPSAAGRGQGAVPCRSATTSSPRRGTSIYAPTPPRSARAARGRRPPWSRTARRPPAVDVPVKSLHKDAARGSCLGIVCMPRRACSNACAAGRARCFQAPRLVRQRGHDGVRARLGHHRRDLVAPGRHAEDAPPGQPVPGRRRWQCRVVVLSREADGLAPAYLVRPAYLCLMTLLGTTRRAPSQRRNGRDSANSAGRGVCIALLHAVSCSSFVRPRCHCSNWCFASFACHSKSLTPRPVEGAAGVGARTRRVFARILVIDAH